jgi:hypothetical protein
MSDVVLRRIQELEGKLKVPEKGRYVPGNLRTKTTESTQSD